MLKHIIKSNSLELFLPRCGKRKSKEISRVFKLEGTHDAVMTVSDAVDNFAKEAMT